MEKEALITVILNDLKEVETLVRTFNSPKQINQAFLRLTLQKIATIKNEIELLETLDQEPMASQPIAITNSSKPSTANAVTEVIELQEIETEKDESGSNAAKISTQEIDLKSVATKPEPLTFKQEPNTAAVEQTEKLTSNKAIETNIQQKPEPKQPSTLGELMGKDKTSVADKIVTPTDSNIMHMGKPVVDINKAIGINDRFMFQRELFGGKESKMNQTVDQLNQLKTFEAAELFLKSNFDWDFDADVVQTFLKIIHRKFIS